MNAAHWLAWILIGWEVVATIWQIADKPVERIWHSNFYLISQAAVEIAMVTIALTILI